MLHCKTPKAEFQPRAARMAKFNKVSDSGTLLGILGCQTWNQLLAG